ncbi:AAA domain-containing protein [Mesoflavibacter zeaxanthinifaciens]|uniref:AAA domain-containing protein n=1 Tax=Mesoflavibacter zeaxanthinifaciens TaxID=393060 RepID=UPI00048A2B94|nr:AAA domain-containing protein [Mesoflavibacter zeaxanthinifaciens]
MIIPNNKHIQFYKHQIKAQEDKWKEYANTEMHILIQEKKIFYGEIWGVQNNQGNVILRFKSGQVPRMKEMYFLGVFGAKAPDNLMDIKLTYEKFRSSKEHGYYTGINTEISTVNYWKVENGWSYIIISGFDLALITKIDNVALKHNKHPKIVIAKKDPPIDYLLNLKEFVVKHPKNSILKLNLEVNEDHWNPINIDNSAEITKKIIRLIDSNNVTVIQGPPGTGKSYLAAEICDHYNKNGDSVCVTALTNKALIEVILKDGLIRALKQGIVYKTNLTSDENKRIPNLKNADELSPKQGELLLATYYKLSQHQVRLISESKRFDLLIIEEASQAFLATIAMFSDIATKVLIIGDHKQITPIVLNQDQALEIFPKIDGIINGLLTYSFNNNDVSYRLTKTRRLTSSAAKLTGLFYNNSLKSISDIDGKTNFKSKFRNLFHPNGGITIAKLPDSKNGFSDKDIYEFIAIITTDILKNNNKQIAVLSPYIDTESSIYEAYSSMSHNFKNITISTIQKIQGLTSDFTIVYLPLRGHDLQDNLFNVATSRAKQGTLIITYNNITFSKRASIETMTFINSCKDVSKEFLIELIK